MADPPMMDDDSILKSEDCPDHPGHQRIKCVSRDEGRTWFSMDWKDQSIKQLDPEMIVKEIEGILPDSGQWLGWWCFDPEALGAIEEVP